MKVSLKTKISTIVALFVIFISIVSTFLFTSAYSRSIERELVARGNALVHTLARAAERGLTQENLDLLNRASHVVRAEDVSLVQVYSNIWTSVDSYPLERFNDPPIKEALEHFGKSNRFFYKKTDGWYEFYTPVMFKPFEDSMPIIIGYARLALSSSDIDRAARRAIFINIVAAVVITVFSIIAINALMRRLVINPVMELHKSVKRFKEGTLPEERPFHNSDELGELASEFGRMSRAIKNREVMLIESEKRIKNLFERVEHAIFRLDKDGNILETNKKFDELCGSAKKFCSLFTGHDTEKHSSLCLQSAVSNKVMHAEEKIMGKDGGQLIVFLSLYPETDPEGSLRGFDGYFIDVTEKKGLENALIHSEKLKSLGILAGGIAHDFNNLLTSIMGYSTLLKDVIPESDKTYRYVDSISRASERAANLTRQLLGFARRGKYMVEIFHLGEILAEIESVAKETFDRRVSIVLDIDENLPPVEGDKNQIYQAFINLCMNAMDAMQAGGRIYIKAEYLKLSDRKFVDFFHIPEGEYARVSITDTGAGMTPEVKAHMFEPFFTTKDVGKGTGLGLSMVYGVVKNHGGHITVYSEPGLGTTVRIYLPKAKGAPEESKKGVSMSERPRKGTILIIDDEDIVRELGKDILEAYNYAVLLAGDGKEGVKLYTENKGKIDLVILDIIMPEKGGREAFKEIKSLKPDAKVLICTGHADEGAFRDLLSEGVAGLLLKPFQSRELIGKVEALMAGHSAHEI